jgi:hypothetical protein
VVLTPFFKISKKTNNNNNNQFLDDQFTYESIHGALNAAAADHHCVRWCQKKPVLVRYPLASSTRIILFVELLKFIPQKINFKEGNFFEGDYRSF